MNPNVSPQSNQNTLAGHSWKTADLRRLITVTTRIFGGKIKLVNGNRRGGLPSYAKHVYDVKIRRNFD